MSRFQNSHDEDTGEGGIDISPLIDCVFIMLIFFIVTTTFVEDTGVEVDKQFVATKEQLEKQSIYIALTNEGDIVYAGKSIGITGVQPVVRRMWEKDPNEPPPVIIELDAAAPAGVLTRVIEEAKLATEGQVKVSIATESD